MQGEQCHIVPPDNLPAHGWVRCVEEHTGKSFYANLLTKASQWEEPQVDEPIPVMPMQDPPSHAATGDPNKVWGTQGLDGVEAEDPDDSENEGEDGYRKGGYHPVQVGEFFKEGRYRTLAKLGWGHFSTVWLCQDNQDNRFVALKCQKSAPHYTEAAFDEIELLASAAKHANDPEWLKTQNGSLKHLFPCLPFTGVVTLIDYFEHQGVNGKHVCMVFEVMGPNVLALIKQYKFKGIPLDIVRKVSLHTLIGLDYLHRVCNIIHTDLKPENVLVACPKGVPINKFGVPIIGEMDRRERDQAWIRKRAVMSDWMMSQRRQTKKQVKGDAAQEANGSKADKKKQKKKDKNAKDKAEDEPPSTPTKATTALDLGTSSPGGTVAGSDESGKFPPFMKPHLKPSRSDPTLLSSYPEAETKLMMLEKPLYNHLGVASHLAGTATGPGSPVQASIVGSLESKLDPKLLSEILSLDLFSHETVAYKVADLGNACWTTKHFSDDIQTRQYRGPETIIHAGYDTSADIWSLACMTFEMITGDYLFDPKASEEYPRDEDHLALFIELLGPMPPALVQRGRKSPTFFNRRCHLRHIKHFKFWSLDRVLIEKYNLHPVEAISVADFLLPMLRFNPSERATAKEMLNHPWVRGLPSEAALSEDLRSVIQARQPSLDHPTTEETQESPVTWGSAAPKDTE